MASDLEGCPHLRTRSNPKSEATVCGLLQLLTHVDDETLCEVPRGACSACREGSTPSEIHLNPIVASLLFNLTTRLLASESTSPPGYDLQRAHRLRGWAEENLFLGADPESQPISLGPTRRTGVPTARPGSRPRIGLVGSNTPSGLGSLNRDLATRIPVDRWLVLPSRRHRELPRITGCRTWQGTDPDTTLEFLEGLDWLLFCEQPQHESIVSMARHRGIRIGCVPMWEHLDERSRWIRQVDLMICPTRYCHHVLERWRERLGLDFHLSQVPWPIDLDRFPFRQRTICRKFLYINGHGGMRTLDQQTPDWDGRKGLWIIREAAKRAPSVPILIRTQTDRIPPMPANVEIIHADPEDSATLYEHGDVCIQPSRWEGLGLPLLECQASGLPLITTDAPPMNEHQPWITLPASSARARLSRHQAIPAHEVDPDELAKRLLTVHGSDISEISLAARRFVEHEHSWAAARPQILDMLSAKSPYY